MAVPLDIVRASLEDLWKLDKTQCNQILQSYNGAAASAIPMTMRFLAFTVVVMMLLVSTTLFSSLVRMVAGRQTLNFEPSLRILLRFNFVLFLPALSSVFSLTKAQGGTGFLLTLLWLLLVELIRMKVQVMVLPADGSSFSRSAGRFTPMDHADEVGYIVWAGFLVFFNMEVHTHDDEAHKHWAAAMKAMFAILWLITVVKLMQRIFNKWKASRSWYTGRNPLLISAYMQHVTEGHSTVPAAPASADAVMEMCPFVVEGEHQLVFEKKKKTKSGTEAQPKVVTTVDYGYGVGRCPRDQNDLKHASLQLDLMAEDDKTSKLVTVGQVWQWGKQEGDVGNLFRRRNGRGNKSSYDWKGVYLQDLCLSFSLFKLLRRRFEQYPMVEVGSDMARRVMLEGLLKLRGPDGAAESAAADRPFRVLQLELDFVERYYQAADRVAMSSHRFFIFNMVLSTLLVPIYFTAILAILVTTKDSDHFYCMAMVSITGHLENFPFLCFYITLALLVILLYGEAYEISTSYLNFNWNLVRLVCFYGTRPGREYRASRRILDYMFRIRFWMFSVTTILFQRRAYCIIMIKQVSIVDACGKLPSVRTKGEILETKDKEAIIQAMTEDINMETFTISLPPQVGAGLDGRTATRSATEIILASHLATELFEFENLKEEKKKLQKTPVDDNRRRAIVLSRYCMYLVARMPELLPDDEVWASERLKDMRTCLAKVLQNCGSGCMLCMPGECCKDAMLASLKTKRDLLDTTTRDAVELFDKIDRMEGWKQLASFWVRLIIYLAPSNDVQGHAKAVVTSGGDLITCLWAFCTHAGITRQTQEQQNLHGHGV